MSKRPKERNRGKDFYMKFNVSDYSNDPKLVDCNAIAHGVYIKLLCTLFLCEEKGRLLVKSECLDQFASILLKQNDKQTNEQIVKHIPNICSCVAPYVARHLRLEYSEVEIGLAQLLENDVVYFEGKYLCQKRMIKDYEISQKRAAAGGKGGESTQRRVKNFGAEEEVLPTILLKQNDKQNKQQKPNYNYNSNYNYSSLGNEGGIGLHEGVQGDESLGGEKDGPQIADYENKWHFETPVQFCKHFYFSNPAWAKALDGALMVLGNYYRGDKDLPKDQQWAQMLERLVLWADEYNDFLDRSGQKNTFGQTVKVMSGPDGWPNHFHNWLLKQKDRLRGLPNKRIDNQQVNASDSTSALMSGTASTSEQEDFYSRKS